MTIESITLSTRPFLRRTLVFVLAACLAGCGPTPKPAPKPAPKPEAPAETIAVAPAPAPPPALSYAVLVLSGDSELRALRDSLGPEAFAALLAVNRVDLEHLREGDSLSCPRPGAVLDSLSPFPARLAIADSCPKLLLVSNRVQAWSAYEHGVRVRWGPCCTGRKTKPTPPGLYHTNWKQTERRSTVDGSWILKWYVNLESMEGVSFHVYELPGRPSSHSCVRLGEADARWIYDWCETWTLAPDRRHVLVPGTPTLVLDRYAFGERRPWRALPADAHACDIAADSIAVALRAAGLGSE